MLQSNGAKPTATLLVPVVFSLKALSPNATLNVPIVLHLNVFKPTAVLFDTKL